MKFVRNPQLKTMELRWWLVAACAGLSLGSAPGAERDADVPLSYVRIDLTDGRKLKDVVVKSYDAKSEKVLVIAEGKAMSIPLAVFPKPFNEWLKSAPPSGGSVNTVAAPPARQLAAAADQYIMEARTTAPAAPPAARSETPVRVSVPARQSRPETPVRASAPARPPPRPQQITASAPSPAPDPAVVEADRLRRHLAVAQARARMFYRYEHQIGSNSIVVTALEFEFEAPKARGYTRRVETKGKAFIQFYDSVGGGNFQRTTSEFEIVTDEDPTEGIKAIDFTRKS